MPGKVRVLIDLLVERFGGVPFWDRCLMREAERKHLEMGARIERDHRRSSSMCNAIFKAPSHGGPDRIAANATVTER